MNILSPICSGREYRKAIKPTSLANMPKFSHAKSVKESVALAPAHIFLHKK